MAAELRRGLRYSPHALRCKLLMRFFNGRWEVDGSGKVFENDGWEAELGGGYGGGTDAEVEGEPGEEESVKLALAEIAGESGGGGAVVLGEGGVAVNVAAEAFTEDELGVRDVDVGMEIGASSALDTVIGPEGLGAVGRFYGIGEGLLAGV